MDDALKDIGKLLLVIAGFIVAIYLAVKFWWIILLGAALVAILLVIEYIANDRFRE